MLIHYLLLAILDVKSRDDNDQSLPSIHLVPTELYQKESCINVTCNKYKGLKQVARTQQTRHRDQMEALQGHWKNSVICAS